jgi:hypothetical protein
MTGGSLVKIIFPPTLFLRGRTSIRWIIIGIARLVHRVNTEIRIVEGVRPQRLRSRIIRTPYAGFDN